MARFKNLDTFGQIEVNAPTYITRYRRVSTDLIYFEREQNIKAEKFDIDVFGRFWSMAIAEVPPGAVSIRREGLSMSLSGRIALWIPFGSIIEWQLGPGILTWGSLVSKTPYPDDLPTEPFAFSYPSQEIPSGNEQVWNIIREPRNRMLIGKIENANPISRRLKLRMDEDFPNRDSLSNYAKELGVAHETMTRYFRQTYGISPQDYRTKARILQAMTDLLFDARTIANIGHDLGYEDLSSFNEQFRKITGVTPSLMRHK